MCVSCQSIFSNGKDALLLKIKLEHIYGNSFAVRRDRSKEKENKHESSEVTVEDIYLRWSKYAPSHLYCFPDRWMNPKGHWVNTWTRKKKFHLLIFLPALVKTSLLPPFRVKNCDPHRRYSKCCQWSLWHIAHVSLPWLRCFFMMPIHLLLWISMTNGLFQAETQFLIHLSCGNKQLPWVQSLQS